MKINTFAICYNEETILPHFIKYYQQFGDVTIYDNYSTDKSVEIIKDMGANLIQYNSGNQIRDDIYLKIKNNCWKGSKSDWVVVCDVDEFIYHEKGLINALKDIPHTMVRPIGYNMITEHELKNNDNIFDLKKGFRHPPGDKIILFKPDKINEINYQPGAHQAKPIGDVNILNYGGFKLLHYKFLGLDYIIKRYEMYRKRLSDINKKRGWGTHYQVSNQELIEKFNKELKTAKNVF